MTRPGTPRRLPAASAAALLSLTLGACSTGAVPASAPASSTPSAGPTATRDVPITSRGVASIVLDHLPADYAGASAAWVPEHPPEKYVGGELRYDPAEASDGDLIRVSLWKTDKPQTCSTPNEDRSGCVELQAADGNQVFLAWEVEAPEEDPGLFSVWVNHPGETVYALSAGPVLKGDPRKQPLRFSPEALRSVVIDERLRLLTTQDVIDAGQRVERWQK